MTDQALHVTPSACGPPHSPRRYPLAVLLIGACALGPNALRADPVEPATALTADELVRAVAPDGVTVTEVAVSGNSVTVSAKADRSSSATSFLKALEASGRFDSVSLTTIQSDSSGSTFRLGLTLMTLYRCAGLDGKLSLQHRPCPEPAATRVPDGNGPWVRGLVITESSKEGDTRTMYAGGLSRMLTPDGGGSIVDLGQNRVTILDAAKRTATVGTVPEALSMGMVGFAIGIFQMQPPKALGVRKKVLNHDCEQYEVRAVFILPITTTYCLSTTAPGVAVVREFQKKMLAHLPDGMGKMPDLSQSGIVLSSESSFGDASQVTRIEEDGKIAQAMFKVPAGYTTQPLQDLFRSKRALDAPAPNGMSQ